MCSHHAHTTAQAMLRCLPAAAIHSVQLKLVIVWYGSSEDEELNKVMTYILDGFHKERELLVRFLLQQVHMLYKDDLNGVSYDYTESLIFLLPLIILLPESAMVFI